MITLKQYIMIGGLSKEHAALLILTFIILISF